MELLPVTMYVRMPFMFLLFLGLGVPSVKSNPMPHHSSCKTKPELIMSAFFNSCKVKRSHGQRPVGGGTAMAEFDTAEIWEILFNDLNFVEEELHTANENELPSRRKKKSDSLWRRTPRTLKDQRDAHDDLDNGNEIDSDDPSRDSSSPLELDTDAKLWKWIVAELEASRGGWRNGGRMRREEYSQVLAAVHKCCHVGCDASDFPC